MSVKGQSEGIAHGTPQGYGQHQYRGVPATEECGCLKAKRDAWATVALEDGTGEIEVLAFPKNWTTIKPHLQVGRVATVTGRLNLDSRSGRLQLFATGLAPAQH